MYVMSILAGIPGGVSQSMLGLTYLATVQDAGTGLLATIEDFMWYKLALVRPISGDGPSTSGYFSGVCLSCWLQVCVQEDFTLHS
jgi:hypothetical protein